MYRKAVERHTALKCSERVPGTLKDAGTLFIIAIWTVPSGRLHMSPYVICCFCRYCRITRMVWNVKPDLTAATVGFIAPQHE